MPKAPTIGAVTEDARGTVTDPETVLVELAASKGLFFDPLEATRSDMRLAIPWWLTLIVIVETLPMFIGPVLALSLPPFMGGPGAEEINQAAFIYSARNLAVGLAFLIAFALRDGPMLFILIFIRLVTDLIDLPTLLSFGLVKNMPLAVSIFVFLYYIPALFALRYLWGRMRDGDGRLSAGAA